MVGFDHTKTYLVLPVTQRHGLNRHINSSTNWVGYEWLQLFAAQNGFTIEAEQFYHIQDTLNILIYKYSTDTKTLYAEKFAYGGSAICLLVPTSSSSNETVFMINT